MSRVHELSLSLHNEIELSDTVSGLCNTWLKLVCSKWPWRNVWVKWKSKIQRFEFFYPRNINHNHCKRNKWMTAYVSALVLRPQSDLFFHSSINWYFWSEKHPENSDLFSNLALCKSISERYFKSQVITVSEREQQKMNAKHLWNSSWRKTKKEGVRGDVSEILRTFVSLRDMSRSNFWEAFSSIVIINWP